MASKDDNIAAAKAAAFEHISEIGKREGQGAVARIDLAEYVTKQSQDGVFEPDDAAEAWTRMSEASLKEQDSVGGSEQTFRQRVSDIRHFILLGNNKNIDGVQALADFKARMQAIRADRTGAKGRVWPMMLKFAQAQAPKTSTLTVKAMDECCTLPPPPAKPKRVEKLWRLREALNAANERFEDKRIQQAISLIDETVTALGGTKSQRLAAKKAEANAREKAKKAAAKAKKIAAKSGNGTKRKVTNEL